MGVVILTAGDARRRARDQPATVDHCTCPIFEPCRCGREAQLVRLRSVSTADAGWAVAR